MSSPVEPVMQRTADISPCGRYRWTLGRTWDPALPVLLVVMFNPSTASHEVEDPTSTLVSHIAAHNSFGAWIGVNLTPLRSSVPGPAIAMLKGAQPDGNAADREVLWRNVTLIAQQLDRASAVLLAWGSNGAHAGDWYLTLMQELRERRPKKPLYHLGKCANGHPKHPLARGKHKVPKDAPLLPWEPR